MQNEHHPDHEDLAKIRRSAEYRRVQDLGNWLRLFFERRRQSKLSDIDHSVHDRGGARLGHPPRAATSG